MRGIQKLTWIQVWLRNLNAEEVRTLTALSAAQIAAETGRSPPPRRGRLDAGESTDARPYAHPFYRAAFNLRGARA